MESPLWATRGRSWSGEAGFSVERWRYWKIRFAAIESGNDDEIKKIAETAVRAMEIADTLKEGS